MKIVSDLHLWQLYTQGLYQISNNATLVQNSKPILRTNFLISVLDLHGYPIEIAYQKTNNFLINHYNVKTKKVDIITGRSGIIKLEFPRWCESKFNSMIKKISLKPNMGSYTIVLRTE